uniref:Uncharacterized protein n=1 Tax=Anguilla anguilla TaxID=7936 RepID=A0A0E9Q076_ANGAN
MCRECSFQTPQNRSTVVHRPPKNTKWRSRHKHTVP